MKGAAEAGPELFIVTGKVDATQSDAWGLMTTVVPADLGTGNIPAPTTCEDLLLPLVDAAVSCTLTCTWLDLVPDGAELA